MSDLRDDLAKRLYDVGYSFRPSQEWDMDPEGVCGVMADECIRQMVYQLHEVAANDALSVRLAPDDWKP